MRNILFPTTGTISLQRNGGPLRALLFVCMLLCFCPAVSALEVGKTSLDKKVQDTQVYHVVSEFMLSIRKGSLVKAYQTFTSRDFRESTSLTSFTSFVSKYPTLRRNRSVELIKIQYHENIASVDVNLSSLEHVIDVGQFILRYDEGRWRIISIQLLPSK